MDEHGFVDLDELLEKLGRRFKVDERLIFEIVDKSDRQRFEIVGDEIRALYGHTMPVKIELNRDKNVKLLYHGTTADATSEILKVGLKPMKRRWVHLSPTMELARETGLRRTRSPVVLEIDAEAAIKDGLRFYKATDKVYISGFIPPRYITMTPKS